MGGQSPAAWYLRSIPQVQDVFRKIWRTNELICSLDTAICWRPWWANPDMEKESWLPSVERLHCDQNPFFKHGFHCVQGMLVLCSVTPITGGLQVAPRTHGDVSQARLRMDYPSLEVDPDDWCELAPE